MRSSNEKLPRVGFQFIGLRMPMDKYDEIRAAVLADWNDGQSGSPNISHTIRRLINMGLIQRTKEREVIASALSAKAE